MISKEEKKEHYTEKLTFRNPMVGGINFFQKCMQNTANNFWGIQKVGRQLRIPLRPRVMYIIFLPLAGMIDLCLFRHAY